MKKKSLMTKHERKLIKLANKSLLVSLPYEWVEKMKLKKGDTIEVKEMDKELIISPIKLEKKEIFLDLKKMSPGLVGRKLLAAYKAGFGKIIVDIDDLKGIDSGIKRFEGLILTDYSNKKATLQNSFDADSIDFHSLFFKNFFLIQNLFSEILEMTQKNDFNAMEEAIKERDYFHKNINTCISLINRKKEMSFKESNIYFYTLSLLDIIVDLLFFILKKNYDLRKKFDTKFLKHLKEVSIFFSQTSDGYIKGDSLEKVYESKQLAFSGDKTKEVSYEKILLQVITKMILELIESKMILDMLRDSRN